MKALALNVLRFVFYVGLSLSALLGLLLILLFFPSHGHYIIPVSTKLPDGLIVHKAQYFESIEEHFLTREPACEVSAIKTSTAKYISNEGKKEERLVAIVKYRIPGQEWKWMEMRFIRSGTLWFFMGGQRLIEKDHNQHVAPQVSPFKPTVSPRHTL